MVFRLIFCLFIFQFKISGAVASNLNGTFMHLGDLQTESLPAISLPVYFRELKTLGMSTVVIHSLKSKFGNCERGHFQWIKGSFEKLKIILDEAHRNKMQVYLGLVSTMNACPTFYDPKQTKESSLETSRTVAILNVLYGTHPSLAGWYIPDEPAHLDHYLTDYFTNVAHEIRKHSQKPIMVSPYLKGIAGTISPADLALRARNFRDTTNISIQAWQDSRGADAVMDGESYFMALSKELGLGLWANLELFNWGADLFKGGGYKGASIVRFRSQLKQANAASQKLSWLAQYHLKESSRLRAAYLGKQITPKSYHYLSSPSHEYADQENELTNNLTGDPKNHLDPQWIGFQGDLNVNFEMGVEQKIDWIGVHILRSQQSGIKFPLKMEIYCEEKLIKQEGLSIEQADSEYVFSNQRPLKAKCKSVRIHLPNDGWTFVSEVEFTN